MVGETFPLERRRTSTQMIQEGEGNGADAAYHILRGVNAKHVQPDCLRSWRVLNRDVVRSVTYETPEVKITNISTNQQTFQEGFHITTDSKSI